MSRLQTLLRLGRISNLPTVWSNCLAGWWLGGDRTSGQLPFLLAGTTFLYLGGMFLNDAFDADFDRQYRKERPIPAGAISTVAVWRWGFAWLAIGAAFLFWLGPVTGVLGLILSLCIVTYDAIHKLMVFSPILMGVCRFWVYVLAASAGWDGVTGWALWCGLALGAYVTGLSFLARHESARRDVPYWALVFLAFPILLAGLMNAGRYREPGLWASAILALWTIRSLRPTLWGTGHRIGRTVSGLLAGIVFVDLLAVADAPHGLHVALLGLFLAALLFQRFIPAT